MTSLNTFSRDSHLDTIQVRRDVTEHVLVQSTHQDVRCRDVINIKQQRNLFACGFWFVQPKWDPSVLKRPEIGQRIELSQGDINQAKKMYHCPSKSSLYLHHCPSK